jgi:hypothetical protein
LWPKLIEREKEITKLKYQISEKLFSLKESNVAKNLTCNFKCDWKKSISTELMSSFRALEHGFRSKENSSCNFCEKHFANVSHLDEHMRTTQGNLKHECGSCKETFSTPDDFIYHMATLKKKLMLCFWTAIFIQIVLWK